MTEIVSTLKKLYDNHCDDVEGWLASKRAEAAPFFYSSVDLRHSGLRLAPVDTNLFPAGFNNISPAAFNRTVKNIKHFIAEHYPQTNKIVIIPENHTRNLPYFDNLATLLNLFNNAGVEVKIGSLVAPAGEILEFTSANGVCITQYPITKHHDTLILEDGFTPELIIMNNDMTSGVPEILHNITQPIIPSTRMGWYQRRKSVHFKEYKKLATDFGLTFDIDSWLISAESKHCGMVNFKDSSSLDCLATSIDNIIAIAKIKHAEYGVLQDPYIYVKADSGTYGMGIMTVNSGSEILELNKKERNKMLTIKEGAVVSEVIIQEGIATIDKVDDSPAEPMVYLIDGIPIGGMYRVNNSRDEFGNLNAAGMRFTGMCDESEDDCGRWKKIANCNFRSHGIIASIAALAAAREQY